MDITFSLGFEIDPDADELLYVESEEVLDKLDEYCDYIEAFEFGFELGEITIKVGEQQTMIADTLRYLILGLCFQAVPPLLNDETFTYRHFDDAATTVQLLPQGDAVYISGKWVTALVCPRQELVEQLYACGMRYLAFLRALDAQYETYITSHIRDAEQAKQAINAARQELDANE